LSVESHKANYTWDLQNTHLICKGYPDKNVPGEERKVKTLSTVFPAPHGLVEREKRRDASLL
jgi:hypothetical protein